ncbi:MAG: hypothetical protein AAF438_06105, partial [Pseudomonadota bacterium]
MEQKTQSVLCCLCGDEYSDPTQFVMERLFASANLDWKVITAQIQSKSIEEAIAGIQALKLSAIRFGHPFDAAGQSSFLNEIPDVAFVGAISAALDEGDNWTGWHSFGPALVELLSSSVDWSSCTVLLCGDSIQQRSSILHLIQKAPAKLLWHDAGESEQALKTWMERSGKTLDQPVLFSDTEQLPSSLGSASESSEQIVVIEPSQVILAALATAEPEHWDKIAVWDPSESLPQEFTALASLQAISPQSLNIAIDEYDFRRWTGAEP